MSDKHNIHTYICTPMHTYVNVKGLMELFQHVLFSFQIQSQASGVELHFFYYLINNLNILL